MVHYFVGNLGHFFVILSFVAALIAVIGYWLGSKEEGNWTRFANISFWVHGLATIGIVASLFYIISNNYFEYHYAWSHASKLLPWYYQLSCFWEGQEGSFLLWMFWNVAIGFVLIRTNRDWRPSVMAVLSITQLFLTTMILGVVVFGVKIGSSPFLLLRDVIDAPIFKTSPEFIPEDGSGLNPLLQNYWMVIHPPTLFLGFATTVVPFAFCIAGILRGKFKEWIRPALPWAQFSTLILGVGILMGAYWAYETLNFGGYWNWDPVENAIYVPWLVMVAAVHTMIVHKNNGSALKLSMVLVVTTFLLILYSTFLTRSGVLGESSVHSFTDLGLSGQLLIYLAVFVIGSIWLLARAWKNVPGKSEEVSPYTREFWIFLGAATLCLMAFQVILPTSIPVWNRIVEFFGGTSNMAPPTDPIDFYSNFQLFLSVALAILSGTGQFFWWKKMSPAELRNKLTMPVIISLSISAVIFATWGMYEWRYILLLTASVYSIVSNAFIFVSLAKTNIRLSGGAVAHIGIAMMLIGILFSSGYSNIISTNYTGYVWNDEFPDEVNQNNLLLFQNEPRQMAEYSMLYKGMRKYTKEAGFVDANQLAETDMPNRMIVRSNLSA
ncbi:MAG: cytochrome c biogenesis protein CcsA, partial [Cyclobacteriaceae bacterium]